MDTRTSVLPRPGYKILDLSGKDLSPPPRKRAPPCDDDSAPPPKRKRRNKNKKVTFDVPREDFKLVEALKAKDAEKLDKLRDDIQDAIARVGRVQAAFVKELYVHRHKAERLKQVIKSVTEIQFHVDLQTKIVSENVKAILESKAALAKKLQEEHEKAERLKAYEKEHESHLDCDLCSDFEG
jgi:chromosome segregation ATPase